MKNILMTLALAVVCAGCGKAPAPLPETPSAEGLKIIAAWSAVTNDAVAAKTVRAAEGTARIGLLSPGAVRLPVDFSGREPVQRANWDIKLPCDLRDRPGVQFDFYCSDMSQFTSFSCYFKSGEGWYHGNFAPDEDGVWTRVKVTKGSCGTEGKVEGWEKISLVRISGWRAGSGTPTCAIANFSTIGGDPDVAIVYADSLAAKGGGEAKGYTSFANTVCASLQALGLDAVLIADTDLAPNLLRTVKAVVLPYNPAVPSNTLATIRSFVLGGGKVMACYNAADEVCDLIGVKCRGAVRPESKGLPPIGGFLRVGRGLDGQPTFSPQQSWMTSVVEPAKGAEVVAMWGSGKQESLNIPALVRSSTGVYMSHVWLGGVDGAPVELMRAIVCDLAPALKTKIEAQKAAFEKKQQEIRAWLADQPSRRGEHRAFWCHSARGLGGDHTWDSSIKFLKENGFNTIIPNLCWGGIAFYDSKVLPVSPDVDKRGDALVECLAACRKYGVKCHVWKVCWNMGSYTSKIFEDQMTATNRVQVGFKGQKYTRWLCPSHPDNQQLEVDAMCELAKKGVDGIHFDYIRYPDNGHCFCDGCRQRFEAFAGTALTNWPAQVRTDADLRKKWTAFRTSNITKVVKTVAERVRKEAPGVQISAAVFRNPSGDPDSVGQDWSGWCRAGYLDFVCNMDYVDSPAMFASQVRIQKAAIGKTKIYPGIGLSCWVNDGMDALKFAKQIQAVRKLGLDGFTVFNFDRRAERVLPLLRTGVTKED